MLFPDWANGQEVKFSVREPYTLDKDAFVIISELYEDNSPYVADVRINNVEILRYYTVNAFPIIASKGDVFSVGNDKYGTLSILIFPLVKGGVRVSSYHIVSFKSKSKKENLCH